MQYAREIEASRQIVQGLVDHVKKVQCYSRGSEKHSVLSLGVKGSHLCFGISRQLQKGVCIGGSKSKTGDIKIKLRGDIKTRASEMD